jgi:hypothetical protein
MMMFQIELDPRQAILTRILATEQGLSYSLSITSVFKGISSHCTILSSVKIREWYRMLIFNYGQLIVGLARVSYWNPNLNADWSICDNFIRCTSLKMVMKGHGIASKYSSMLKKQQ